MSSLPTTVLHVAATTAVVAATVTNNEPKWEDQTRNQRDLYTQFVISISLGLSAFIAFCILRPKWTSLYAARRETRTAAFVLPELPDSLFGWVPVLYRITDEEVLASAGLDAYVFLSFFKYAIKFLSITFILAAIIILPIHLKFSGKSGIPGWDNNDGDKDGGVDVLHGSISDSPSTQLPRPDPSYLWMYVVFTYVLTGLAVCLLIQETTKIIQTRQRYLGSQSSTTDRTIRLSGIPPAMLSEGKIKEFIEGLQIGKVQNVTLCRDWRELDILMTERSKTLRKLERAWIKYQVFKRHTRDNTLPLVRPYPGNSDPERSQLLWEDGGRPLFSNSRPTVRLWYGPFKLRYRSIDAIDYYEETLRRLDEKITAARKKECPPTELAFVTMESTSACQMLVQAILDPHPMQFIASLAPAPADIFWKNTYLPRSRRKMQSWLITAAIGFLTIFWSVLLIPVAYLLELETLHKVFPSLAEALSRHPLAKSLVQTGLPTLTLSLLTVAVPYLYAGLSSLQGTISKGDMELSVISKNFFFSFFNLFLVFTVFGTATNFIGLWDNLRDAFKDTTTIAFALAKSLESFSPFYINFIVLQGLGLFPFRLLEFGSVAMYPINFLSAKTPRERSELPHPPTFNYGYSVPQTILIFIICVVYSVFPSSWLICLCGLVYFSLGRFIYKYQLLYAMNHQQHSTGRAWPMICNRVFVGLVVFQLAMIGVLALRRAITRSLLLVPLLIVTVWFTYSFSQTYDPLMKFIALRSVDRDPTDDADNSRTPEGLFSPPSWIDRDSLPVRVGGRDISLRLKKYVNPNLILPLDGPWIPGRDETAGISYEHLQGAQQDQHGGSA